MIRSLDLFRQLLFYFENMQNQTNSYSIAIDGYSDDEIAYHCLLLSDAELIEVTGKSNTSRYRYTVLNIDRLKNEGHNFIAEIRDETKWVMAKSIMSAVKQVTVPVLRSKLQEMTALGWDTCMEKIHSMAKAAGLL